MVIEQSNEIRGPICDTNIIFNFSIINLLKDYIDKNGGQILITDFVKLEIEEKLKFNDKYAYIINSINDNENIVVLEKEQFFDNKEIKMIDAILCQFGLEHKSFLDGTLCKDIGEFSCAIYAANLDLKYIVTHDLKFIRGYSDISLFSEIKFHNMIQALDATFGKEDRKIIMKEYSLKEQSFNESLEMSDALRRLNNKLKIS